jgi:large subunit ribosomal protein L21
MEAYAVIETGGKQYRVQKGDTLDVELLGAEAGAKIDITRVLAISDGAELKVGAPEVAGAAVTLEVIANIRGKKVVAFKKKRRKGYHKKIGHRQELTRVKVADLKS